MTTNKPEVKRYDCTSGRAMYCYGCYTMEESELGDYVEWEAYEALQAECERLARYYKNGIDCFANPCEEHSGERTPPFPEFFEKYGGQCLICVVDNNKSLQAELARLREDAERWRALREMDGGSIYALLGDCDGIHPEQADAAIAKATGAGGVGPLMGKENSNAS